jgi:hypothetical protein
MTTINEHKEIIKEFFEDLNEKIKAGLLAERQKIVGFAASEASTNLFALLLHSKNLIEPSFSANHRFFASQRIAEDRFNFGFSKKEKILELLVKQEEYRIKLCYGKRKSDETVNSAVKNLFELREIIEEELEAKNG